jgi:four helix bundle protein
LFARLFDSIAVLGAVEAGPCSPCSPCSALASLAPARGCARLRAVRGRFAPPQPRPLLRAANGGGAAGRVAGKEDSNMLHVHPVVLEVLQELRGLIAQIQRRDADLTRQLRRCAASVALNLGEGMYSRGKNRSVRYHTALGSAREILSCLEVAHALGYVGSLDAELVAKLNRVIGTLVRLVGH